MADELTDALDALDEYHKKGGKTLAEVKAELSVEPWPLNGYAPGGYHCKCHECGKLFEGDKRAVTCLVCAVVLSKRAARLSRPSTAEAVAEAAPAECWEGCEDPECPYTHPLRTHPSPQGGAEPARQLYAEDACWCSRCRVVFDYGCSCPDGKPLLPLVTKAELDETL